MKAILFLTVVGASALSAAEPGFRNNEVLADAGFRQLFDGSDLSAWDVKPGHVGHWTVNDGVLHYDGQATEKTSLAKGLWTKEPFGDSAFYVEWRLSAEPHEKPHPIVLWNGDFLRDDAGKRITRPHMDAGDSGILFRGVLKCQANIWSQELGSGEINGYRVDRKLPQSLRRSCIPTIYGDNPLGEWNAFLVTLKQDRMTVELNGKTVLKSEALPDLPSRGSIGLQHHGDVVEFRNIWVKALDVAE